MIGPFDCLTISGDGKRLFSTYFPAGADGHKTIVVWDVETAKKTLILRGHTKEIKSALLSADGKRLFSASGDNTIKIWDIAK